MNLANLIPPPSEGNDLLVKLTRGADDMVDVVVEFTPDHATWKRKAAFQQKDAGWDTLSFRILEKHYTAMSEALRYLSSKLTIAVRKTDKDVILGFCDGPICLLCYCTPQEAPGKAIVSPKLQDTPKNRSPQERPSQAHGGAIPAKTSSSKATLPAELILQLPRNSILQMGAIYGMEIKRLTPASVQKLSSHLVIPDCFSTLSNDVIRQLLRLKGITTFQDDKRISLITIARDQTW